MYFANQKLVLLALVAAGVAASNCQAQVNPEYIIHKEEQKVAKLGREVAIYAYPLVMMSLLKQYATYTSAPGEYKAPINQFAHSKHQPTPLDTYDFPNIDALSSSAWLDLSNGPQIFHLPATYKRFYLFEVFDGWTNIISTITAATSDSKAMDFMFCGPDFKGITPNSVTLVRSRTNMVHIKGLIQCFGPNDYNNIHPIQDGFTLTPLANFGQPYSPPASVAIRGPIATKESPASQVSDMNFITFYNRFADLLKANPPCTQDVAICKTMAELGMNTEKTFDAENTNRALENGLEDAFTNAKEKIDRSDTSVYTSRNNWKMIIRKENDFGTDYFRRTLLAKTDLPASLSQNILEVTCERDGDGNRLNGMHPYMMHITKDELPPVKAFWSLTLYNESDRLVYNPSNIYAIQSFADSLHFNKDGSCDIYIQPEKPDSATHNWLPCPKGNFSVMYRLYQPETKVLDGDWIPSSIRCLDPIEF